MRRVAEALGVSRSQLHERLRRGLKGRGGYRKDDDAALLEPVRRLGDERPTYGYRRIGALLNRERVRTGLPKLNHKRIYRLMAQNGLLLQRYTGRPPGRLHDGRIITIRPNLRWTSDGFEIPCWNGEVVRVAFALDICDREAMAWCASTGGISGETIRDLMLKAVERCLVRSAHRSRCNGSPTMEAVIEPMRRSTSLSASGWCRASPRCAVRNPTAWPRHS